MKKILIVCVNYNSYDHLQGYLHSIEIAKSNCDNCIVDVYVADNSTSKQPIETNEYKHINIKIYLFENLGYLGGASAIINNEIKNIENYDFVIISNVDVLLTNDFFNELINSYLDNDVAWISPRRISTTKKIILRVEKKTRPSKMKIQLACFLYKFPILKIIQSKITWNKYIKKSSKPLLKEEIYVGCGSIIILTKIFFIHYKHIEYPIFLYGEELFLAELIYKKKLKVIYSPNIIVLNEGEVSTKKNSISQTCKYQYQAITYIKNQFFDKKK